MSVCATCHQPGITGPHDCPGIGEIQVTRQRGRGVIVDHAPARALLGLRIIRDLAWPANIAEVGDPDLVNIADQVLYRVIGYDREHTSLIVELVEDWRTNPDGDATTDGTCTATIKSAYTGHVRRCAQPAKHYDEKKQPDPTADGEPGGWHRSAPDRDGDRVTWSDWASGATPHKEQP
ncbi:hypothetical protein PV755_44550 [Streptomyces caniscabiei]|uniref:hypothetical protein n=1 Tax=Streptomyces caniscabiei TaxID=2746961 RepID=UPI0029A7B53A|nr:hypothetical protein [Streptomyces caniscabiei]MDX3515893.1 hypothetical protein [Streptomyces caniscabiei]MDX3725073.1 hypothetical protein [Streptomyces caniscabiei]